MKIKLPKVAEVRKFLVTVVGALTEITSLGLLHGTAEHYVTTIVPILTAVLTYKIPNKQSGTTA